MTKWREYVNGTVIALALVGLFGVFEPVPYYNHCATLVPHSWEWWMSACWMI